MKQLRVAASAMVCVSLLVSFGGRVQGNAPLKLVQTIPMPRVRGRMDHMTVDIKGKRLLIPAIRLRGCQREIAQLRY